MPGVVTSGACCPCILRRRVVSHGTELQLAPERARCKTSASQHIDMFAFPETSPSWFGEFVLILHGLLRLGVKYDNVIRVIVPKDNPDAFFQQIEI